MNKPDVIIIQKFYENRCSEDEYRQVINYLNSLDEKELNEFMNSHINKLEKNELEADVNSGLNFAAESQDFESILRRIKPKKEKQQRFVRKSIYSIAASIVFFLIVGTYALHLLGVFDNAQAIVWNEKTTKLGQKSILTLFDGTRITLNADSKLRYPVKFGKETREVHLEGEAYFEVTRNIHKPFIVKSGEVTTTVLGTKFNVKAYPAESNIKVSLVEGRVKVSKETSEESGEILLLQNQQMIYNRKDSTEKIVQFDIRKTIGWRNNALYFENEPLSNVLLTLERSFGVELEMADESLQETRISADFENESFWAIIEVVKYLTELETKTIGDKNEIEKVLFYKTQKKGGEKK